MKRFVLFVVVILTALCRGTPANGQGIYFDDSGPEIMVLGNGTYEIGFRKSNGSVAYITDKSTGQQVTLGSRYECLWGAWFPDGTPSWVGGCSFAATWPNRFSYAWSAASHTLTLNYTPNPASSQQVTAGVEVVASEGTWFDMRLEVQNNWGSVLEEITFPCDLVFVEADIEEALLPILPGVVLEPAFFQQDRSYMAKYPGYPGFFADYVSLSSTTGQIAIYSLYGQGPMHPVSLGFWHDDAYVSDSTVYAHGFGAGVGDGQTWTTPWVRIRIAQSHQETIAAYRADNGLDQLRFLKEKVGLRYDQLVRSPMYKADTAQLSIPFSQYPGLLSQVPTPGILHPVGFQPGEHDENYPDFLPPDPRWGTTEEFAAMFRHAQSLGFLVMPYTNPTWWDDESPTLQNLLPGTAITDVAVLDSHGPLYEYYGSHGGYVVSPSAPFVQQRLGQLVISMTLDIPSDMLLEDQIGARPWLYDHNASSPYPTAYVDAWLEHTRAYSNSLLMTELAFDRLAETEVGFNGSVLLPERYGYTVDWWGTGTWHPYPLAPLMARDKVLFYQHDLAPETFTVDKETLTWNLAFGYMLSYDLVESEFGGGLDSEWLGLAGTFQKNVVARYADEPMTDFTYLEADVTQTVFETYTVVANWDEVGAFDAGEYTLPPLGVVVTNSAGTLTAGVFSQYNGVPLTAGDHCLIEDRALDWVTVYQPIGADTSLVVDLLPGWSPGDPIEAWAYTAAGEIARNVPVTVTAQGMTFVYRQQLAGQPVVYYKVLKPSKILLPLIVKH
jgi:hypothetical protein